MPMTPHQFIARWQAADLSERAACQSHFADLCAVLGQPKPTDVDPTGSWYAFEKGVDTSEGRKGWADVRLRGKFGWEMHYTGETATPVVVNSGAVAAGPKEGKRA